jgi:hypothetical protein
MSIRVEWSDTSHTIVHYHLPQEWTWDQFHAASETGQTLMSSVEHSVDMVLEMDAAMTIPPRVLHNMARIMRQPSHPNVNRVVLVGGSGLVRNLASVLRTLYPVQMSRVMEAQTLEHGLRLLSRKAQTGRLG